MNLQRHIWSVDYGAFILLNVHVTTQFDMFISHSPFIRME